MAIPRLERLMNLAAALLDTTRPLSVEDLRERVEGYEGDGDSFRRQFERDKEALREMGVPISVMPVPGSNPQIDGYRIIPAEYYLPDPGLDADELAALRLASRVVHFDGAGVTSGMWKLGGVAEDGAPIDSPAQVTSLPSVPYLATVFEAATSDQALRFVYRGSSRQVTSVRLGFRRGHWYLAGFETTAGEPRLFRLDRVEGSMVVEEAPRDDPPGLRDELAIGSLEPWRIGDATPIVARIVIDRAIAATVVHEVGADRVVERRDSGDLVIELDVTNPDGFRSWVLGLLEHAEVLEPPELRAQVVTWLRDMAGVGG